MPAGVRKRLAGMKENGDLRHLTCLLHPPTIVEVGRSDQPVKVA